MLCCDMRRYNVEKDELIALFLLFRILFVSVL